MLSSIVAATLPIKIYRSINSSRPQNINNNLTNHVNGFLSFSANTIMKYKSETSANFVGTFSKAHKLRFTHCKFTFRKGLQFSFAVSCIWHYVLSWCRKMFSACSMFIENQIRPLLDKLVTTRPVRSQILKHTLGLRNRSGKNLHKIPRDPLKSLEINKHSVSFLDK